MACACGVSGLNAAEQSGLNRPPIAAPVTAIPVQSLPVVRSQSEVMEDFITGLLPGLLTNNRRVDGVAFIAVRQDHIVLRKEFGVAQPDAPFEIGTLSDLVAAVAAMQQIEQAKMLAGEMLAPGITLEQALTHQVAVSPEQWADAIARSSGEAYPAYLATHVFAPLKMSQSKVDNDGVHMSLTDIARLMGALLSDGSVEGARLLQPATVDLMERTHTVPHPALPGAAYGFIEMRRNGWRALVHDGEARGMQLRLVLIPDAKLGYFVLLRGSAGAGFWRTLDNTLFDRVFTPKEVPAPAANGALPPSLNLARAAEGVYGPASDPVTRAAPLKMRGTRLNVNARDDAALVLSGAENAILMAKDGGYWSDASGNLAAIYRDGRLLTASGRYGPLALYLRWDIYLLLGLVTAFLATAVFSYEHRGRRMLYVPSPVVLASGAASLGLLLAALLFWLLLPAV